MFYPTKFIVIDDKKEHLFGITKSFESLGSSCIGIEYNRELGIQDKAHLFKSVRIIFCDFHLIDPSLVSDDTKHCAIIADLLETNINEKNGPFILIIWTENDHVIEFLKPYLDKNIHALHCKPIAIFTLAKNSFIRIDNGEVINYQSLQTEIIGKIKSCPQVAAFLSLEYECFEAFNEILYELISLIPTEKRNFDSLPEELDIILSRLAVAAVGKDNVAENPRSAITKSLTPLLEDKIINIKSPVNDIWKNAITKFNNLARCDNKDAGKINASMHLSKTNNENISAYDWGAVIQIPDENLTNGFFEERFYLKPNQIYGGDFKIPRENRKECKFVLIRIGAACDYAQNQPGTKTYILGLIIPECVQRTTEKTSIAEWKTPYFFIDDFAEPFIIVSNARFNFIPAKSENIDGWPVLFRLREQLLMQLISHSSNHIARAGIIDIR